jgi:glycosyltransferase involved in cell wall biosynthesis
MAGDGAVAPASNPDALAKEIYRLAKAPITPKEWGTRSRECYEEHFAPGRTAERYLTIYREFNDYNQRVAGSSA